MIVCFGFLAATGLRGVRAWQAWRDYQTFPCDVVSDAERFEVWMRERAGNFGVH